MKTVVLDSPHQDSVVLPAIGKELKNGVDTPMTDEDAAIALQNPHVRLVSDSETPSQRAIREQAETDDEAEPEPDQLHTFIDDPKVEAPKPPVVVTPPAPAAVPASQVP